MEERIDYRVIYSDPHRHFLNMEMRVDGIETDQLKVQLPAWRPGRYELSNFAKNVQKFEPRTMDGQLLRFKKLTKDLWQIDCAGNKVVKVEYNYYANELNAGSTYLDEKQMYVNPVNCFLYLPDSLDADVTVHLDIPSGWKVATALRSVGAYSYMAQGFHKLADGPFIASGGLQHGSFTQDGVLFHLWFQGEFKTDWQRILDDFKKFSASQIEAMGGFPVMEYHFLYQIRTYKTYHGVEHSNSTVIALGPSYDILKSILYDQFLGVSSHELFHAWNVKALRPKDMQPYDYSRENYSRLGYVAEGVTTYVGDLFLFRSGCFSDFDFFKNIHKLFQRHFHNYGRFNLSVADSSFDTWLDGYSKGIPDRKTSIYTEGALFALMLDIMLLRDTENRFGLLQVMKLLYERFGNSATGYSEEDYRQTVDEVGGKSHQAFFNDYYYGLKDAEPELKELLAHVGLEIKETRSGQYFENRFGFKVEYINGRSARITDVAPDSIADRAKLKSGDEIISINGIRILGNLKEWCNYFEEETVTLTVNSEDDTRKLKLTPTDEHYYSMRWPQKMQDATDAQKANFKAWTLRGF